MKTKITVSLIILLAIATAGLAQKISYNAKAVKLVPESTFLPNADWGSLFYDASQSDAARRIGVMNEVAIGPQEQVYVCNRGNYTIQILDKTGRVTKTFGKKGYKNGEFAGNPYLRGILNNKLLVVNDGQGRINFFDLDGNFVKLIAIGFVPMDIFPMKSGNLIVWGSVPMSGCRSKSVIAELNYESGKYSIIYEKTDSDNQPGIIQTKKDGLLISFSAPYVRNQQMVRVTSNDRILLADNTSKTVKVFSKESGRYKETSFELQMERLKVGAEEKQEYYQNFKKDLEKRGLDISLAEKVKAPGFYPDYLPYFYNIILDEQNNALFFIFTNNEKEDYVFQAYSGEGKFLGQSAFEIENYALLSQMAHFHFTGGFVYTLALKHDAAYPVRILKCRMEPR
ncbi:MAG: hypothetical protein PHY20_06350 [Bacteroidales bacterium]|nr:hypothetical protein [Bacteroidales bacterium]